MCGHIDHFFHLRRELNAFIEYLVFSRVSRISKEVPVDNSRSEADIEYVDYRPRNADYRIYRSGGDFDVYSNAVYLRDRWAMTPGLAVNLGIRWEFYDNRNPSDDVLALRECTDEGSKPILIRHHNPCIRHHNPWDHLIGAVVDTSVRKGRKQRE